MPGSIIWLEPTHPDPRALAAVDIPSISMMAGRLRPVIFGTRAKYQKNSGPGSLITQDLKEEMKMCDFFDFDWMDLGMAGALAEEMAEDERNQKQIEDDFNQEDDSVV